MGLEVQSISKPVKSVKNTRKYLLFKCFLRSQNYGCKDLIKWLSLYVGNAQIQAN